MGKFLMLVALSVCAAAPAGAQTRIVTRMVGDVEVQIEVAEAACPPEAIVSTEVEINGATHVVIIDCDVEFGKREALEGPSSPLGDWAIKLSGNHTAAVENGPKLGGVDVSIVGSLRMGVDWLYGRLEAGAGGAFGDTLKLPGFTGFAGLEFRPKRWLTLAIGGRHRVGFDTDGDQINAPLVELQMEFRLYKGLHLGIAGAGGWAWYPVVDTTTVNNDDGSIDLIRRQRAADAAAYSMSASILWRFD